LAFTRTTRPTALARPARLPQNTLAGLAVFAASACAAVAVYVHFSPSRYPVDLAVYREAGRVLLRGGNPYAASFGRSLRVPLPFTYPPFGALVALPLGLLPAQAALAAWTVVSFMSAYLLAAIAFRPAAGRLGARQGLAIGIAGAVMLWTVPVSQTLGLGQVNLPLALAALLDCTWTSRRRGVLVGIASSWKLTPGLFIVYFAATRQWAAAARAAATAAACALAAAVVLPGPSRQYWLHFIFDTRRPGDPRFYSNQSLLAAVLRLHLPGWLWLPMAAGALVWGLRRAVRAHQRGYELAAVALVGLTILLVSPIAWQHHAVWLVVVFGVLAAWAETPLQWTGVAAALGLFCLPLPSMGSAWLWHHQAPVLATAAENAFVAAFAVLALAMPLRQAPGRVCDILEDGDLAGYLCSQTVRPRSERQGRDDGNRTG
jgi:alpha-1,2-mannosyltransferase